MPPNTTTNYATEKYLAAVKALQELVYPPDAWALVEAVFRAIGEPIVQDETEDEEPRFTPQTHCLRCGTPSTVVLCPTCWARAKAKGNTVCVRCDPVHPESAGCTVWERCPKCGGWMFGLLPKVGAIDDG